VIVSDEDQLVGVLIADAHSLLREALAAALSNTAGFRVVAEVADGREAVTLAGELRPDVAVLDADLPPRNAARTVGEIRERAPVCRVLVVAGEEDEDILAEVVHAGASGYLTKGYRLTELITAIRQIHAGDTLVPTHMLGGLLDRLIRRARIQDEAKRRLSRLTPREREVLELLAQGGDNDSIADQLVISPETARTHIQNVLVKLGVHSRLEAAAVALHNGLRGESTGPF
jgi:DNA-binding NarL/FixJ family response regulator